MKKVIALLLFFSVFSIYSFKVEASTYGVIESETNRTLVPVRLISEMFGVKVGWEQSTQSVILDETYRLTINSNIVVKDGLKFHEMNTKPRVIRGSVYVPARDIANILGVEIEWLGETSEVKFTDGTETFIVSTYWESMLSKEKVTYTNKDYTVQGKKINVNIVSINLLAENTSMHVEVAQNTLGATDTLMNIAKSNQAIAAINGNYFDAYTPGVTLRTVYNGIVIDGKNVRTFDLAFPVFYYTKDGDAGILPGKDFLNKFEEGNIQEALQIGPTLMRGGQIWLHPQEEGFTEEKILTLSAARSAVGVLPNRQVVFLTTRSATISQLATIMKELGATDAMNFDGGASSGLYYNGKYITTPGRNIPVTLLVK